MTLNSMNTAIRAIALTGFLLSPFVVVAGEVVLRVGGAVDHRPE